MGDGPHLVAGTFPDGQQRLAWKVMRVTEVDRGVTFGVASTVFIDAMTGDPLLLVTGVQVSDPTVLYSDPELLVWLAMRWLPVYALAGYLVLVGLIAIATRLWGWLRGVVQRSAE